MCTCMCLCLTLSVDPSLSLSVYTHVLYVCVVCMGVDVSEKITKMNNRSLDHSAIYVYKDNPFTGQLLPASYFTIGGKEYRHVIPYFTEGVLLVYITICVWW